MAAERYKSFTTGTLLPNESLQVASLYTEHQDWDVVRELVLSQNLLQARTTGTLSRLCNEIISRLRLLGPEEIDLLANGNSHEQGYLLWLAVCRRYALIRDFALEVLHERHLALQSRIESVDFEVFFNRKAEWHPELERMTEDTRRRLGPMLFKMMRQAGLLSGEDSIAPAYLGPRLVQAIARHHRADLALFPTFETE